MGEFFDVVDDIVELVAHGGVAEPHFAGHLLERPAAQHEAQHELLLGGRQLHERRKGEVAFDGGLARSALQAADAQRLAAGGA